MMLKRPIFLILLVLTNIVACQDDNNNYRVDDIEVFKDTPVWELAKAIDKHDIKEVETLLKKHPNWVNYQEPKYGISLLYWTIFNSPRKWDEYFYEESKLLITYGANPYQLDQEGHFPLQQAADIHKGSKRFIELCLSSQHTAELSDSLKKKLLNETLIKACGKLWEEVESVKLLVESGADVNYFNADSTATPVSESLVHDNMNTAKYLIIDQGAKYDYNIKFEVDNSDWYVLKILSDLDYSEEPDKQRLKEEIVAWIEKQEGNN